MDAPELQRLYLPSCPARINSRMHPTCPRRCLPKAQRAILATRNACIHHSHTMLPHGTFNITLLAPCRVPGKISLLQKSVISLQRGDRF